MGEKPANPHGLYDMHGNVWEWTLTSFADSKAFQNAYRGREAGIRLEPVNPADLAGTGGGVRVFRGGSYGNSAVRARAAFRNGWPPGDVIWDQGFRVVLPSPRAGF